MATRSHRIPSEQWERHRQTIIGLYKQKPLKNVKTEMAALHGFEASISQFEAQLKQWGARKNLKRKEWEALFEQNENAESDVTTSGMAIASNGLVTSRSSVKRARRWVQTRPNAEEQSFIGSFPDFAAVVGGPFLGMSVDEDLLLNDETALSSELHPPWNCPIDFGSGTAILSPITKGVMQLIDDQSNQVFDPMLNQPPVHYDVSSPATAALSPNAMLDTPNSLNAGTFPYELESPIRNIRPFHKGIVEHWAVALPFGLLDTILRDRRALLQPFHVGNTTARARPGPVLISAEQMLWFEQHRDLVLKNIGTFLPGEDGTVITSEQALETKAIRLLLFSMMNGIAPLEHAEDLINLFCQQGAVQSMLLQILKSVPHYISQALTENLLKLAVEAGYGSAVELLLQNRPVDVNAVIYFHMWGRLTLLERAADLHACHVIEILITNGADIHKTYAEGGYRPENIIVRLLQSISHHRLWDPEGCELDMRIDMQQLTHTLRMLINAGARASARAIGAAVRYLGPTDAYTILSLLVSDIEQSEHQSLFQEQHCAVNYPPIVNIAERFDDADAAGMIRHIINICKQSGCGICLHKHSASREDAIIAGARGGKLQVVRLLIDFAPSLREIFCNAIYSNNGELIDFVIERGAELDPPAIRWEADPDYDPYRSLEPGTTPLALAVRTGNQRLINILELAGALDHLDQGGRFEPLIAAVCEVGYVPYIEKLLLQCYSSRFAVRPPKTVLHLAIKGGHDGLALRLLNAGAEPCFLLTALRRRDSALIYAILNSGVGRVRADDWEAAIDWADTSILSDLAYIDPRPDGAEFPFRKLCEKYIRNGDKASLTALFQSLQLDPESCLAIAVELQNADIIEYFLGVGADPYTKEVIRATSHQNVLPMLYGSNRQWKKTQRQMTAKSLSPALEDPGSTRLLDYLLGTGAVNMDLPVPVDCAPYTRDFLTPLGLAIVGACSPNEPNLMAVEAIIKAGSDVNGIARIVSRPVRTPETALLAGVSTGKESVVRLLLNHGADVNKCARICMRRTSLQRAAEMGHLPIVRLLLENGADVNAEPAVRAGGTALQFAAISGNCNVAKELLQRDAQLDARPSKVDGRWALEGAAEHGRLDMIQFLWDVAENFILTAPPLTHPYMKVMDIPGFTERQCLRAMNFAKGNGNMGCALLISELSGIDVGRIDTDEYGAPWLAY